MKRIILDVSTNFHTDVKSRAAKANRTMKQYIIEALAKYMMNNQ